MSRVITPQNPNYPDIPGLPPPPYPGRPQPVPPAPPVPPPPGAPPVPEGDLLEQSIAASGGGAPKGGPGGGGGYTQGSGGPFSTEITPEAPPPGAGFLAPGITPGSIESLAYRSPQFGVNRARGFGGRMGQGAPLLTAGDLAPVDPTKRNLEEALAGLFQR